VIDAQESFYFKPDAGVLLVPPANEDPVSPQDVQPEELDVAIAVDRVETATTLQIRQVRCKWAGLRSFVADKSPVLGFAPDAPASVQCLRWLLINLRSIQFLSHQTQRPWVDHLPQLAMARRLPHDRKFTGLACGV